MSAFDPRLIELLSDERWRLRNLYSVEGKDGGIEPFRPRPMQERLLDELHWRNIILKARQLGFSTLIAILFLDRLLFGSGPNGKKGNLSAGIIDITKDDAALKLDKIRLAYKTIGLALGEGVGEEMRNLIHSMVQATVDNTYTMEFSNGSSVQVGTAFTGSTLHLLHVSEFGKIALKSDKKAEEIIRSALPAARQGLIFFESTHRGGRGGRHYKMLKKAQETPKPDRYQFKFHFFPWWEDPEYAQPAGPRATEEHLRYFRTLEEDHDLNLTREQKNFWITQECELGLEVKREFPSVPEDAFDAPVDGAIYGRQIAYLRAKGRIYDFDVQSRYPVWTFWDLGQSDYTSIWAIQLAAQNIFWIDWYEDRHLEPGDYAAVMREWATRYPIAGHFIPHDGGHRKQTEKTYKNFLEEAGLKNVVVVPVVDDKYKLINELRSLLKLSTFHTRTAEPRIVDGEEEPGGLGRLELYRTHDNKAGSVLREMPVHDENSHTADAGHTFANAFQRGMVGDMFPAKRRRRPLRAILAEG